MWGMGIIITAWFVTYGIQIDIISKIEDRIVANTATIAEMDTQFSASRAICLGSNKVQAEVNRNNEDTFTELALDIHTLRMFLSKTHRTNKQGEPYVE